LVIALYAPLLEWNDDSEDLPQGTVPGCLIYINLPSPREAFAIAANIAATANLAHRAS
jgi:hypothetical protein